MMDYDQTVRDNHGLVVRQLRRFSGHRHLDREDLLQIGRLALWKAAETFDPAKGGAWGSFATLCVQRAMMRHVRDSNALKRRLPHGTHDLVLRAADRQQLEPVDALVLAEELRRLAPGVDPLVPT